jgi:transcriptional regulator with XRE-family HTH domain
MGEAAVRMSARPDRPRPKEVLRPRQALRRTSRVTGSAKRVPRGRLEKLRGFPEDKNKINRKVVAMQDFGMADMKATDGLEEGFDPPEESDYAIVSPQVHQANQHVANRLRLGRAMLGLSQQQLAPMIGISHQQIYKYERGLNRISAGRLYDFAQVFERPITWFFEDMAARPMAFRLSPRQRMCVELARNFAMIENPRHQEAIRQIVLVLVHADADAVPDPIVLDDHADA